MGYIRYLWEYRQPEDADATWINSAIIPQSLIDLFNLYFRTHLGERILSTNWENHHGSSKYYDQYFLILLLREFLSRKGQLSKNNSDRQGIIDSFKIPDGCDALRLSYIQNLVDNRLIPSANNLKSDSDSLNILNFDIHQLNDAIDQGLIPFLESLKGKAKQRIEEVVLHQKISDTKIEEFKNEFIKSYYELASVRNLFKFLGLFQTKLNTSSIRATNPEFSIWHKNIEEKEIFFEEWYANSCIVSNSFGQDVARKEDYSLLVKIIKSALKKQTSLDEVISSYNGNCDELIIININSIPEQLYNNRKFQIKSSLHETDAALELVNLSGFIGLYAYSQDHKIPIFNYRPPINPEPDIPKSSLLVIDKSRLGKLVQYSPVEEAPEYQIKDHIAFRIQAFAENDTLMNEYLNTSLSPDWLAEEGDKAQQENYLRSRVLIEIYERFSLELDPNFVGFLIPNNDSDNLSYP